MATGVGVGVVLGDAVGVGVAIIVVLPRFRLLTWTGVFLSVVKSVVFKMPFTGSVEY